MDDSLLMRVVHSAADGDEQFESFPGGEAMPVAVACDRLAAHQFHDEVGPAALGGARVVDGCDVIVAQQGERLTLLLEAGEHRLGVHAGLDEFEGDVALDRLALVRVIDDAEAAFADYIKQPIWADPVAEALAARQVSAGYNGGFDLRLNVILIGGRAGDR